MIAASDIEQMSVEERLQAMELLWDSISRSSEPVESPAWHEDILQARRSKIEAGDAEFLTLDQLRKRLHQPR